MSELENQSKISNNSISKLENKTKFGTIVKGSVIAALIIIFIGGYYLYEKYYPNTDDAYVGANLMDVAPKITGFVQNIYVDNNQYVKKGQLLITINPQDYAVQLAKAKNNQLIAQNQLASMKQQIQVAETNLDKAKADEVLAKQLANRYHDLYQTQAGSQQDMQTYAAKDTIAIQQVRQAQALLDQAKQQYSAAYSQVSVSQNDVQNALNYNDYTKVYAPVDGYVANLNLVKGQLVKAGDPVFGLVDNGSWWVDANFKETQLERLKVGQPATVELDMYSHEYHGIIKSISSASGNTFALLPSENATGNWVKVTQRFTVRVALNQDPNFPLRVGASSYVKVKTTN